MSDNREDKNDEQTEHFSSRGSQQNKTPPTRSRSHSQRRASSQTRLWKSVNPFINFMQDFRQRFPGLKSTNILRLGGEEWRSMSAAQKQPYVDAASAVRSQRQEKQRSLQLKQKEERQQRQKVERKRRREAKRRKQMVEENKSSSKMLPRATSSQEKEASKEKVETNKTAKEQEEAKEKGSNASDSSEDSSDASS